MRLQLRVLALLLLAPATVFAQKKCKTGIPCGGTCIAANKVCRVGSSPRAPSPASAPTPATTTRSDTAATAEAPSSTTKVWVNSKSRVYHCPGTRWYGATKNGSYMTEGAAKVAGNRPANGKVCGS